MRNKIAVALLIALAAGCGGESPTGTDGPVAFTDVYRTLYSGITTRRAEIVSRESRWAEVWGEITARMSPKPPMPAVDFNDRILIVAGLGEDADSCKNVRVDSVERRNGALAIVLAETRPPANCSCPPVVVQPVHVVAVPRAATGAAFTWRSVTLGACAP